MAIKRLNDYNKTIMMEHSALPAIQPYNTANAKKTNLNNTWRMKKNVCFHYVVVAWFSLQP